MVLDLFTHVSRVREEEEEGGFDELSDFEACPGRERGVVQEATDEMSGPSECPGKGRDRHSAKGGGKNDKSSDDWITECPGKE